MNLRTVTTVKARRDALEKETGVRLTNVGAFTLDEAVASTRNCENMIGAAQVPMGIAGPLHVKNLHGTNEKYYLPLATTEGALVASVNRGCKAITDSGGATVDSHRIGATRGPVFRITDLAKHHELYSYFKTHMPELQSIAKATSHHLTLEKIFSRGVGRYRYVRFVFDTQDAMGMNMATIASEKLVEHIERIFGIQCVSLAGNFDIDKKPSWLNFVESRGTKVWAEVTIPKKVVETVLKTSAQRVYDVWLTKCMLGSAMSGSLGFNAQFANVIAALFLATGQDLGHVGEGSIGVTTVEIVGDGDLYVSIMLPDLMVGTVGGGTGLATQKEALTLLGVWGSANGEHSRKFAEIVGGAVLAGEISLLSSLAQGSLARAHQTLARGGAS